MSANRPADPEQDSSGRSEHRLLVERSALLDSAADGIYAIDRDGICTFANRALTRLTGYSLEECLGANMHELIHSRRVDGSPYPVEECPIYQCVASGMGAHVDNEVAWRKDSTPVPVEYSTEPVVLHGSTEGAVVTMRDVSEQRAAREALQSSERRLRLALAAGRMGTWLWDARTNRVHWDEALEKVFGLEPGSFGGTYDAFLDLIYPDDRAHVIETVNEAGRNGSDYEIEFRIQRTDGGIRWIDDRGQVLSDPSGKRIGISGVCWDSTERRQAEHELRAGEARNRAVLETALDGIISIDSRSRIIEFNPAAERIFGYRREDVIGKPMPDLIIPAALRAGHRHGIERHLKTGHSVILGQRVELMAVRADGTEFPVELAINRISGEPPTFTGYVRDITERRRYEAELKTARDAAEEANQAKSQFLASMSHELRTPLNAIIGYSEMLQEEAGELGAAELLPDLGKIHTAGRHLLDLINDVLDLSKIEAGRMELFRETFDACSAAQDVMDTALPLAQKNGNELILYCLEDAGSMHADMTKLRQSLLNLLSNASKFTHNGTIRLEVERRRETSGDRMIFRVSDTGIGIEPDKVERLFEPFEQADASTSRRFGGTGLGLALSRRFCRLMGGDLTGTSSPGEGSVFTIELPVNVAPLEADPKRRTEPEQPTPGADVLVVDDNPNARDLLDRTLRKEGYRTALASSGVEALEMARKLQPAAITLDVMLPGMDGWAVLGQLKADPVTCDIPVIMVTVLEDRNLAYSLGASDYLTKPIDRDRLAAVLRKHHCGRIPCPVLVVEDDAGSRRFLRSILEHESWQVEEAENGVAALEWLNSHDTVPELILLDLMMPTMDGFELVNALRVNPAWRQIPIIVITAKDITEDDRARLNGQVQRILSKGQIDREALLGELQRALAGQRTASRR
jgi:PAS domain S-box-containing protein